MNLNRKYYVGNKWRKPHQLVRVVIPDDQTGVFFPLADFDDTKISSIIVEVAYWRKANAIHRWFVDNVQNGNDNCGNYFVTVEKLEELLTTVNTVLRASKLIKGDVHNGIQISNGVKTEIIEKGKVIKNPTVAEALLPTTSGFFFGGTNYDQYYYEDLTYTKEILEEALKTKGGDFYYSSSW